MPATRLRSLLITPGRLARVTGVHDVLGARLAEAAGFDGLWASSLEIATAFGRRDDDAVTMRYVLPAAAAMAGSVRCPVIADCGTGNCLGTDVAGMVRAFEAAGVAGVSIEDGQWPKRNSLLPGQHDLAPTEQSAAKIEVAAKARRSRDFLLIARVEALVAGAGQSEAVWRARSYAQAGADAILIHSRARQPHEILAFIDAWRGDIPLVLVPSTYYTLSQADMRRTGKVGMVIYANQGIRAAIRATREVFDQILREGTALDAEKWIVPLGDLLSIQDGPEGEMLPGTAPTTESLPIGQV